MNNFHLLLQSHHRLLPFVVEGLLSRWSRHQERLILRTQPAEVQAFLINPAKLTLVKSKHVVVSWHSVLFAAKEGKVTGGWTGHIGSACL